MRLNSEVHPTKNSQRAASSCGLKAPKCLQQLSKIFSGVQISGVYLFVRKSHTRTVLYAMSELEHISMAFI